MKVMVREPEAKTSGNDYKDFIRRYEKGAPWDGYTDQEVVGRYQALAPRLSPEAYEQAAAWSLARFSPQNRILFGQYVHQQARDHGLPIPALEGEGAMAVLRDAEMLAQTLAGIQERKPAVLDQLLGEGAGILDSLLVKAVLAGIVAAGARNFLADQE
ncbi:MAG TPA: hypothetical protein VNL35_08410 [Chloroflexota bacterium]|nr:hypothetical protein [Chloroflexota bacterium]